MNGRRSRERHAEELGLTRKGAKLLDQLDRERAQAIRGLSLTYEQNALELATAYTNAQDQLANSYAEHKAAIYQEHGT